MKPKKNKKRARGGAAQPSPRAQPQIRAAADGRLHLALFEDAASGQARVALTRPVFKEDWQNEITAAAANTAYAILRDEPKLEGVVELSRSAMAATSRLAEGLLAQAPAGSVACRAGCDHCCYQAVGVTALEAISIFEYLKQNLSPAELAELKGHVAEAYRRTGALRSAERFSPEYPCPFLRAGRCSVYQVRPLACRGMNSLDADECASRLRDPESRAAFLASGVGGRSFMEPIRAFHAISAGLQLSLSELYQLDMLPLELTAAMQLLLNGPESIPEAWLAGEKPFEPARATEIGNESGIRDLVGTLGTAPPRSSR